MRPRRREFDIDFDVRYAKARCSHAGLTSERLLWRVSFPEAERQLITHEHCLDVVILGAWLYLQFDHDSIFALCYVDISRHWTPAFSRVQLQMSGVLLCPFPATDCSTFARPELKGARLTAHSTRTGHCLGEEVDSRQRSQDKMASGAQISASSSSESSSHAHQD